MSDHRLKKHFSRQNPTDKEVEAYSRAIGEGDQAVVTGFLDQYPSTINQPVVYNNTALRWAVTQRQAGIVSLLLARGALADIKDDTGWTPLIHAAWNGQAEITGLLLAHGASLDIKSSLNGLTPLMWAVCGNRGDVVGLLLEKGASPDETNIGGKTARMLAVERGHHHLAELIEQYPALRHQKSDALTAARLEKLKECRPKQSPFKKKM